MLIVQAAAPIVEGWSLREDVHAIDHARGLLRVFALVIKNLNMSPQSSLEMLSVMSS